MGEELKIVHTCTRSKAYFADSIKNELCTAFKET